MLLRSLFIFAASLSLCACGYAGPVASAGTSPAESWTSPPSSPLSQTVIDDKVIVLSFEALGVASSAANALIDTGFIKPGSPAALKLADGLETSRAWLNIASAAQRAGQAQDYATAIAQATSALTGIQAQISNFRGK